ncbi:MAG TPA: hypothetical protein VF322_09480 [Gammaproteobacteria bacterium]
MSNATQNQTPTRKTGRFGGFGELVFQLSLVVAVVGVLVERAMYLGSGMV